MRLRSSTAPVLPADADVSRLEHLERDDCRVDQVSHFMSEESEPLVVAVRGLSECDCWLSRGYIVTALAMASSRHRLSVRKSSVLIGALVSRARSVMVWQTSP